MAFKKPVRAPVVARAIGGPRIVTGGRNAPPLHIDNHFDWAAGPSHTDAHVDVSDKVTNRARISRPLQKPAAFGSRLKKR